MTEIVNNDKLTLILTQYGLNRVAEAIQNPSLNLRITKIKFGSGENYEYYTPDKFQENLKGPINQEFYVYKKELLEDKLTISFYTMVSENIGGFDIREVGLYETVDGTDHLFAIGTCQPFVKPSSADNYFIAIDYYIFLKAANLAAIYDQIVLDPEHALLTETDMETMLRTFLFSNANLMQQIGNNSRIVGYNRPTQLYERMTANAETYSYYTLYKNFASVLNMTAKNSIFSFWAFDYSRRTSTQNSIVDLSQNNNYLSTTIPTTSLERTYHGLMSMLSMESANFSLSSNIPVQLYNESTNTDIPFVVAFAISPLTTGVNRTLIAKSNYNTNSHTLEFMELADGSLQIKLFTDASNYLTFTSGPRAIPQRSHSIVLSYEPIRKEFTAFINSSEIILNKVETGTYTHMKELPGTLYCFSCTPVYIGYANSDSTPTVIYNSDGTPYTGTDWTIANHVLKYDGNEASYSSEDNLTTEQLYAWSYDDSENVHTIYTKVPPSGSGQTLSVPNAPLYNEDYTLYTGSDFTVNDDIILYRDEHVAVYDSSLDPQRITLYAWKYTAPEVKIFANRSEGPTTLYEYSSSPELYTGSDWTLENGNVYYMEQIATYDPTENFTTLYPDLTSYITDADGKISQPIDSEVGLISIIKDKMSKEKVRALALLLCATMGINPYISGN